MQAKPTVFVYAYLQKGCDCVHYILICHLCYVSSLETFLRHPNLNMDSV